MIKRHYFSLFATLFICFVTLVLFFTLESGKLGDASVPKSQFHIEIILKAKANPPDFWRIVEQGIRVAGEEYNVRCEVTGPTTERDVDTQIALMEQAITKKPNAIILAAADYEKLRPVCEKASRAGILLVTVDSDVNFIGTRCFVGTDNYLLGQKMAVLVDSLIGETESFGVIGHVETVTTAVERRDGLLDSVAGGTVRMAGIEYCNSSEALAKEQTIRMLELHPEIKCMVGLNESAALGMAYGIKELGLEGQIKMVACDSSQAMIQLMEDGTIQAFVIQNPFSMGYMSVKSTVELLRGQVVPPTIDTESVVVTKEDLYKKEYQKLLFPFTSAE